MITRDSIEQAYSFFHQKWRVYKFSTMEWQRDDIESAIGDYVAMMSPDLYQAVARPHRLCGRLGVGRRPS